MFAEYLVTTAQVKPKKYEELDFVPDADYVVKRFQQKLDSFESWLCGGQ